MLRRTTLLIVTGARLLSPTAALAEPAPSAQPAQAAQQEAIPAGFHEETHVRRGLIFGGAGTFGVLYGLTIAVADAASRNRSGWEALFFIPCVGPLILATKVPSGTDSGLPLNQSILVIDGLGQTAGIIMFIGGFAFPKIGLVRNDLGTIRVLPTIGKERAGLSLVASF